MEEIWSLDKESFEQLKPVHGLIFLFKWVPDKEPDGSVVQDSRLEKIFFAKQLRGLSLSNSDLIRQVHNSFSRQQMFEFDEKLGKKDDDVFHFVGYIPFEGRLYELDGLKEGPVDLGPISTDVEWTDVVRPVIEKRMQKYSANEIHFNLMAVVSDRKMSYEKRLSELQSQLDQGAMDTDDLQSEISRLSYLIQEEECKRQRYKIENIRRRHNYLPFIMELLKILASEKKLVPLIEKAKEIAAQKRNEKEKAKQCVPSQV